MNEGVGDDTTDLSAPLLDENDGGGDGGGGDGIGINYFRDRIMGGSAAAAGGGGEGVVGGAGGGGSSPSTANPWTCAT